MKCMRVNSQLWNESVILVFAAQFFSNALKYYYLSIGDTETEYIMYLIYVFGIRTDDYLNEDLSAHVLLNVTAKYGKGLSVMEYHCLWSICVRD